MQASTSVEEITHADEIFLPLIQSANEGFVDAFFVRLKGCYYRCFLGSGVEDREVRSTLFVTEIPIVDFKQLETALSKITWWNKMGAPSQISPIAGEQDSTLSGVCITFCCENQKVEILIKNDVYEVPSLFAAVYATSGMATH